jgi:hypothetical protein
MCATGIKPEEKVRNPARFIWWMIGSALLPWPAAKSSGDGQRGGFLKAFQGKDVIFVEVQIGPNPTFHVSINAGKDGA